MGKEICFHKIGSIMMAKKYRLQDFYDIFDLHVYEKMTKTGTADLMKCANTSREIYITQTSIGLGQNCLR